jgi:hypothetical protein
VVPIRLQLVDPEFSDEYFLSLNICPFQKSSLRVQLSLR